MDVILWPGSSKSLSDCVIGAGGIKHVNEIYVGVNNTPYKVWPAYANYGDSCDLLGDGMIYNMRLSTDYKSMGSGTVRSSDAYGRMRTNSEHSSWQSDPARGKVWVTTANIDTRGYSYICVEYFWERYSDNGTKYFFPFISYGTSLSTSWSTVTANNVHSNSRFTLPSDRNNNTEGAYVLFDISNLMEESVYIYFGAEVCNYTDNIAQGYIHMRHMTLSKTRPSTSIVTTLTL